MYITGLGTAVPEQQYRQEEGWAALQQAPQFSGLTTRSHTILRKVLTGANGIATRHLALDQLSDAFALDPDTLHARFARHAPELATTAATRALAAAGTAPAEIDALIISTCTGYLCPGLTSYVGERLGLRPDALGLDLVGQGCGAALPNLRTGEALLAGGRARRVLSVCVEVCSAAMYLDDDPGVLISACLFGDGAGAAVLAPEPGPGPGRRVEWRQAASRVAPADRELLRFEQRRGMLRNLLSPAVPAAAARHAGALLEETLAAAGLRQGDIATWIWHAGGREVLLALQARLNLTAEDTRWSAAVLRDFGNISSPCVYFALVGALAGGAPPGNWWLGSFGAGFSCHGALLRVE